MQNKVQKVVQDHKDLLVYLHKAQMDQPQTKDFLELKGPLDHKDKQELHKEYKAHLGPKVLRVQMDSKDQQQLKVPMVDLQIKE